MKTTLQDKIKWFLNKDKDSKHVIKMIFILNQIEFFSIKEITLIEDRSGEPEIRIKFNKSPLDDHMQQKAKFLSDSFPNIGKKS